MSTRVPEVICPNCHKATDSVTNIEVPEAVPKVGDITVCIYCATICRVDADLVPRVAGDDWLKTLPQEKQDMLASYVLAITSSLRYRQSIYEVPIEVKFE